MTDIADLELVIRAPAAPAVTSMTEMSTAAEEMAVRVQAAAQEVIAQNERMAKSSAQMAVAADEMALQASMDYAKMAAATTAASLEMEAATARAAASTEAVGTAMAASSSKTERFVKPLALGAAAAVAVGVAAVVMAGNFESSTNRLVTSAGEVQSNLDTVRTGMLDMAGQVGISAENLSRAMYTIESGGQHGANGLLVLRAAAEGSKAENADLKVVADAVTTALVDYHLKATDAALVTSKLVAATSAGKTTFEELSSSLHSVLPNASSAHVSLNDILGDLAAMTIHGMGAEQAASNLSDVLNHMKGPTSLQAKELALLGMTTNQLADDLKTKGLSGTLQEISDRILHLSPPGSDKVILDLRTALSGLSAPVRELGMHLFDGSMSMKDYTKAAGALDPISAKQALSFATLAGATHRIGDQQLSGAQVLQNYGQALIKATGDATGLNVALMLSGENAGVANGAIKTVTDATVEGGNHVKGWADIQGTFNQKLAQAKDSLGALAIEVGQKLLPPVSAFLGVLASGAQWLAQHHTLATVLAAALGVLAIGFTIAAVAVWAMNSALLASPVTWIILAIVAVIAILVFAIYELVKHWSTVWGFIKRIALDVWHWLVDAWNATIAALTVAALWVKTKIIDPIVMWFDTYLLRPIKILLAGLVIEWKIAWGFASVIIDDFRKIWEANWAVIAAVATWAWDNVIKPVADFIMKYAIRPIGLEIHALGVGWDIAWSWISRRADEAWSFIKVVAGFINTYGIQPVQGAISWLAGEWDRIWTGIANTLTNIYNHTLKPIFDTIGRAVADVKNAISSIASAPGNAGQAIAHLMGFADGGLVPGPIGAPQLAVVHGGEFVVSRDMMAGGTATAIFGGAQSSGSGGSSLPQASVIQVQVSLDGTELHQATMRSTGRHTLRNGNNGLGS